MIFIDFVKKDEVYKQFKFNYRRGGRVWLNALVLKTSKGLRPSGVRIPPPPLYLIDDDRLIF